MNNEQFRRLVLEDVSRGKSKNAEAESGSRSGSGTDSSNIAGDRGGGGGLLGARMKSSIPMTP